VTLIQVFRAVSTLAVLVESMNMLQPAVSMSFFGAAAARSSAGEADVCQVMNPGSSGAVLSSLIEGASVSSNRTQFFPNLQTHSVFLKPQT